jgi:hypothetical protein
MNITRFKGSIFDIPMLCRLAFKHFWKKVGRWQFINTINVQRIVESTIVHNYGPDWQAHQDLPTALGEAQTVGNMWILALARYSFFLIAFCCGIILPIFVVVKNQALFCLFQAYCCGIICTDICEVGNLALFVKACCWGICCCNGRIEFQECPVLRALPCVKNDCWIYHWAMTLMAAIYQAQNFMAGQVLTHIWRKLTKSSLCKNPPYGSQQCACALR